MKTFSFLQVLERKTLIESGISIASKVAFLARMLGQFRNDSQLQEQSEKENQLTYSTSVESDKSQPVAGTTIHDDIVTDSEEIGIYVSSYHVLSQLNQPITPLLNALQREIIAISKEFPDD